MKVKIKSCIICRAKRSAKNLHPQCLYCSQVCTSELKCNFCSILCLSSFNSWTAVATWRWVANDENCGICRMAFDGCCPDCKLPGDDCPLVWGQCSHCFHIHCIVKWLNSQQVHQLCPMCRQEWKFKE